MASSSAVTRLSLLISILFAIAARSAGPFAAPSTAVQAFAAPSAGADPFAAPSAAVDAFAAPSAAANPFSAPYTAVHAFAVPSAGADPFAALSAAPAAAPSAAPTAAPSAAAPSAAPSATPSAAPFAAPSTSSSVEFSEKSVSEPEEANQTCKKEIDGNCTDTNCCRSLCKKQIPYGTIVDVSLSFSNGTNRCFCTVIYEGKPGACAP